MQVDERTQGQPQVHTHEALLRVGDVEHALHTEEIHSPGREELVHPLLDERKVESALLDALAEVARGTLVEAHGGHEPVVFGRRRVRVEQLRLQGELMVEVEAVDVEHVVHGHVGLGAANDGCDLVDGAQASLNAFQVAFGHEIGFVQEQPIGEAHLGSGLVHDAIRLLLIEVLLDVLSIHQGHDAVEPEVIPNRRVHKEGLSHWRRVGHSGSLDHDRVES